jgi:predicted small metal-binding protein
VEEGVAVTKLINCECGYAARAESDDGVVELIRAHMRSDHPELVDRVSDDDLRGWIEDEVST